MKYLVGTAERICAKSTLKTCLVPRLDEFEGQGHHEQIHHFGSLLLFRKTSLASNYDRVCNRAAHYIFTLWFLLSSHILSHWKLDVYTRLAENTGSKKSPSGYHHTNCIFGTKACIDNWKNTC